MNILFILSCIICLGGMRAHSDSSDIGNKQNGETPNAAEEQSEVSDFASGFLTCVSNSKILRDTFRYFQVTKNVGQIFSDIVTGKANRLTMEKGRSIGDILKKAFDSVDLPLTTIEDNANAVSRAAARYFVTLRVLTPEKVKELSKGLAKSIEEQEIPVQGKDAFTVFDAFNNGLVDFVSKFGDFTKVRATVLVNLWADELYALAKRIKKI